MVFVTIACSSGPPGGTRAPSDDEHCVAEAPHAYTFDDGAKADRAGCKTKRIYRQAKHPTTGEPVDDEKWVFCCR